MINDVEIMIKKAFEEIMEEYGQGVSIEYDGPVVVVYNNCSAILSMCDGHLDIKFLMGKPCVIHKKFSHEDYKEAVREMKAALLESCGNDTFEDGDEAIAVYDNAVFYYGIQDGEEIIDLYKSPVYVDYDFLIAE